MPTLTRITMALALPMLVLLPTCRLVGDDVVRACHQYCGALDECGMLPSFLGVAGERDSREDCIVRCTVTTDVRDQVESCMDHSGALESELGTDVDSWCSLGACDRLAECLREEIDPLVIGSGTVKTQVCRTGDPAARIGLAEEFELEQCFDGCSEDPTHCTCEETLSGDDITEICGEWNVHVSTEATADFEFSELPSVRIDVGKISLELHGLSDSITVATNLCEDVLAQSHEADEIPLGLYRTQLVLEGEGGSCYAIPGEQYLVTAGSTTTATWLLPDSFHSVVVVECETDAEHCSDAIDNDRDGLTDCHDWNCRSSCEICDDQVDNDEDEAVDCADPDCDEEPGCQEDAEDSSENSSDSEDSSESTASTDSSDSTDESTDSAGSTDSTT